MILLNDCGPQGKSIPAKSYDEIQNVAIKKARCVLVRNWHDVTHKKAEMATVTGPLQDIFQCSASQSYGESLGEHDPALDQSRFLADAGDNFNALELKAPSNAIRWSFISIWICLFHNLRRKIADYVSAK